MEPFFMAPELRLLMAGAAVAITPPLTSPGAVRG
jgi:hypothetical protein